MKPYCTPSLCILICIEIVIVIYRGGGLFFGLATAPALVEDRLDDAWLQFAEEHPCADSENTENSQSADALMASAAADGGSQQASLAKDELKSAGVTVTKKRRKISMEAMIRGFEKYLEEDEDKEFSHTVAAWHNMPYLLVVDRVSELVDYWVTFNGPHVFCS